MLKRKQYLILAGILVFIIAFSLGAASGYFTFKQVQKNLAEKNVYIAFLFEVYDKIQQNYWQKISDEELSNLFKLGAEKLIRAPQTLDSKDKAGLKKMLANIIKEMDKEKKKEFSTDLANLVLNNLKPLGRSTLYTQKDEQVLKNRVENINPETQEREPTVSTKIGESENGLIRPDIWYVRLQKISPTTFEEFQEQADKIDQTANPTSLILDLRGNVGGSIDILPYFLGPFIGQGQYAYEFFHQGQHIPFKTKTGWLASLVRYKKVVILIDEKTQSSAEVMAATLKKYNVGVLLGRPTKGWGTVEKVFSLEQQIDPNEKYSIFLVHSLTLRDDGQPIEGRGVNPLINIDDESWPEQLLAYFNYPDLIKAIKEILAATP